MVTFYATDNDKYTTNLAAETWKVNERDASTKILGMCNHTIDIGLGEIVREKRSKETFKYGKTLSMMCHFNK